MGSFLKKEITSTYPLIVQDYIRENKADEISWEEALEQKAVNYSSLQRDLLCSVLDEQYLKLEKPNKLKENLKLLRSQDTFVVTSGHQLCLFSGPAFVIYKIAQTIKLSNELSERTNKRVLPVFWMATEDHDFEEISKLSFLKNSVKWNAAYRDIPAGKIASNELIPVINGLKGIIDNNPKANDFVEILENSLNDNLTLADFYRCFINQLFGEYGLIVLDADHHYLKESFKPIIREELDSSVIHAQVKKTIESFKEDYKVQVNPRKCNLFYIANNKRKRVEKVGESYYLVNLDKTKELFNPIEYLEKKPSGFSPNVLMRILYQEHILPNIAYVGGTSEIAYWLEMKDCFNYFDIPMPQLIPRNSVFALDKKVQKVLSKYDLSIKALFENEDKMISSFANAHDDDNDKLVEYLDYIRKHLVKIGLLSKKKEEGFQRSVGADLKKIENQLEQINIKYTRQAKRDNENELKQIRDVYHRMFPEGKWQERKYNYLSFDLITDKNYIQEIYEAIRPLDYGAAFIRL